jgi:serine/threonine protein kinase/tetratricopeptide (TPR) repeat protein
MCNPEPRDKAASDDPDAEDGSSTFVPQPIHPTHRDGEDGGARDARGETVEDIFGPGAEERYEEGEEIGRGGMGTIRRIFDRDIERPVAMKVVREGGDPLRVERFVEEAKITGQLEHPNIVPVHEIGRTPGGEPGSLRPYFTMKLVRGESLYEILTRLGERDPEAQALYPLSRRLQIFLKVCEAVAYAHSKGVIHRDLKPENVMVGAFGEVLLMDWGLAKQVFREPPNPKSQPPMKSQSPTPTGVVPDSRNVDRGDQAAASRTLEGEVMGSPAYMPPEQAAGKVDRIDERTDVWALGAILYGLLCFDPPHLGDDVLKVLNKAVGGEITPPSRRAPWQAVPKELEAVCMKCMARDRAQRYPSVEVLIEDVQAFLDRRLVSAYRYGIGERVFRWVQRHPASSVGLGVGSVLLAFGATLTVFLLQRAEIARMEALQARAGEVRAEAKAETALTLLEKSRRVSAVLRGAKVELGRVHGALVRTFHSPRSIEEKRMIGRSVWREVELYEKGLRDDPASRAAWLALKGWLRRLAGFREEAMELFRLSRETDADVAPVGMEFLEAEGETAEMRKARERFEELLGEVRRAGVWGEASAEEFQAVLEGFQGMQSGDYESARRGLTRALQVSEMAFLTVDLLYARAKIHHRLLAFDEGLADLQAVKKACPDDPGVLFFMGEMFQGQALLAQLRGEDPRPLLESAIGAHTESIDMGCPAHYPLNARGSALLIRAARETSRGEDAEATLRRAEADFTEAVKMSGPRPNLLANRASTLRQLALLEVARGRSPRDLLLRAEKDLLASVQARPDVWHVRNTLAKVYGHLAEAAKKDPAQAKPWLEKAEKHIDVLLEVAPDRTEPRQVESQVFRVLGDVQLRMGEDPRPSYRRAAAAGGFVAEGKGATAMDHVTLGAALANGARATFLFGDSGEEAYREALRALDEAIRLDPTITRAYLNKIVILRRRARFDEAREALRAMRARAKEVVNYRQIRTSVEVLDYVKTAPPWMVAMLEGHQLFNDGDYPGAAPRYERGLALRSAKPVEKGSVEARVLGIARLRLAVAAALAAEGKKGPLDPGTPVEGADAEAARTSALDHLRQALALWPPLRKDAQANSAFDPLRDRPAFREILGKR